MDSLNDNIKNVGRVKTTKLKANCIKCLFLFFLYFNVWKNKRLLGFPFVYSFVMKAEDIKIVSQL